MVSTTLFVIWNKAKIKMFQNECFIGLLTMNSSLVATWQTVWFGWNCVKKLCALSSENLICQTALNCHITALLSLTGEWQESQAAYHTFPHLTRQNRQIWDCAPIILDQRNANLGLLGIDTNFINKFGFNSKACDLFPFQLNLNEYQLIGDYQVQYNFHNEKKNQQTL